MPMITSTPGQSRHTDPISMTCRRSRGTRPGGQEDEPREEMMRRRRLKTLTAHADLPGRDWITGLRRNLRRSAPRIAPFSAGGGGTSVNDAGRRSGHGGHPR